MKRARLSWMSLLLLLASQAHAQLEVDNSSRNDVKSFYETNYAASEGIADGWTGAAATCDPGITTQEFRDAVVLRLNYFRTLAALSLVSELPAKTSGSQELALVLAANNLITHALNPSMQCYTEDAEAAGVRNQLVMGSLSTPAAVDMLVADDGSMESWRLGHRRWMLYPRSATVGIGFANQGSYPNFHAIHMFGADLPSPPDPPTVTWPSAGYFPVQHMPEWWGLTLQNANFDAATVTVYRDGSPDPITVDVLPLFYGDNGIGWRPDFRPAAPLAADIVYLVQVNNVGIGGEFQNFSYEVKVFDVNTGTGVGDDDTPATSPTLSLWNHPNPFNPRTTIVYSIPQAGHIELAIYDLTGRHVNTLVSEHVGAGEHQVHWDGHDDAGAQVASGVYLYQLRAGEFVETKRMVLLK